MRRLELEPTLGVFPRQRSSSGLRRSPLNVHPNTLRHRLERYGEVSGLRPTRVEDTILMKEAV